MSHKLQFDHSVETISNAFHPFEVVIEIQDYREKIDFRVLDETRESVLHVGDLDRQQVTTPGRLQNILEDARRSLTERGFPLSAWSFSQTSETSNLLLNTDAPKRAG